DGARVFANVLSWGAERTGFEPVVEFYPHTGLANRRYRPLSHLSGGSGLLYRRRILHQMFGGKWSSFRSRSAAEGAPYANGMRSIVIVGGGISGLALAYRLQERLPGADVVVLEAAAAVGGKVATTARAGFRVEPGPNGFLDTKPTTLALCRDLGLGPRLIPASDAAARNRYLFQGGKLRALPGSLGGFLRSDLLSFRGKLAFFLERFRNPRQKATDESIAAFARRRAGREAAEGFADALVTGIYAGGPAL